MHRQTQMNASRVLHAMAAPPRQSMDLAMQLCLSQSRPLYHLLSMSSLRSAKALREPSWDSHRTHRPGSVNSLSSSPSSSLSTTPTSSPDSSLTWEPRSCLRRHGCGSGRKRVVFADARGLDLAVVRHFIPEPSQKPVFGTMSRAHHHHLKDPQLLSFPSAAKPQVTAPPPSSPVPTGKRRHYQLKLASPLPAQDFSAGLKDAQVRLESCSVSERGLMGTARVACSSEERAVHVHMTFDAWRSHQDVPCILLLQRCGNTETDVFAFHLLLPRTQLDPSEGVEFCLSVRVGNSNGGAGAKVHWDNNMGKNYRVVCMESEASKQTHARPAQSSALSLASSPPLISSSPSIAPSSSSPASPALGFKNYINPRSAWSRQGSRQLDLVPLCH